MEKQGNNTVALSGDLSTLQVGAGLCRAAGVGSAPSSGAVARRRREGCRRGVACDRTRREASKAGWRRDAAPAGELLQGSPHPTPTAPIHTSTHPTNPNNQVKEEPTELDLPPCAANCRMQTNVGPLLSNLNSLLGLGTDVSSLQSTVAGQASSLTSLNNNLNTLSSGVNGITGQVNGLTSSVNNITSTVNGLNLSLGTLSTNLGNLKTSVDPLVAQKDSLLGLLGGGLLGRRRLL